MLSCIQEQRIPIRDLAQTSYSIGDFATTKHDDVVQKSHDTVYDQDLKSRDNTSSPEDMPRREIRNVYTSFARSERLRKQRDNPA